MTRKIDKEKYERILKRLARGESQKLIVIAEKCSYGTISAAKHWNKTWKSTTISTSINTTNMTKIVVSMPNFWLERLNEDIVSGIWTDYSDAVLDIIRTYFRTRNEDFQPETRRPLNLRKKILGELKGGFKVPNKNLHSPSKTDDKSIQKLKNESHKEFEKEKYFVRNLLKVQKSDKSIFKNYHGEPLIQEEFDVLMELEHQIGKIPRHEYNIPRLSPTDIYSTAFPITEKMGLSTLSYIILGNYIIGLVLPNKGLTTLPKTIHQLKYLQLLDLRNNRLTELPETIGQLEYLDELILDNNALTSIPESMGNLKNLTILQLDSNELTAVPKSFGNLRCDLFLANNKITSVDKKIQSKGNVDLSGNPMQEGN